MGRLGRRLVITCEHASNRLPARYGNLGLTVADVRSHIAWDLGARTIARRCARHFSCPYHEGEYSRLLVDLNRSTHNPRLMPRRAWGVRVPGNEAIAQEERARRIASYYQPYRDAVYRDIEKTQRRHGSCVHLSIHTFTPQLRGRVRRADIGILYDPARAAEREFADRLAASLKNGGLSVRRNYPYRGTSDGLTTFCRARYPVSRYLGIELELNQRLVTSHADARRLGITIVRAIPQVLEG
ncbi:MAG: N-formylglutamate amidohydrolase [Gemmatimonadetes bacterium]|nr:N-formylglutamate amidohydrolase [Gemmatimonadota bacterium]NIO31506.1 N-formylglutamate amidohydrolase [Gemmatimonadota bacterium]